MKTILKNKLRIGGVLSCLILVVLLFGFGRSKGKETTPPARLPEVAVIGVEQKNVSIYSEWIGTTDGMVNADIKAQVAGYLLQQDYQEGLFVQKGQLLFEIDPRPFQAALDQASGQVAQFEGQLAQVNSQILQAQAQEAQANSQLLQAQAQLAQAQANQIRTQLDADRYTQLVNNGVVSRQEYDTAVQVNAVAKAQVKAAEAAVSTATSGRRAAEAQVVTARAAITTVNGQIENAKAAVRAAELNLGFTRITSPIDGIVGVAKAQVGDLVSAQSAPLTTVSTVDPIKVYFTLSEQEYLNFTRRNLITAERGGSIARLELELVLADGTTYPQKGSFYLTDRQVDQKTGAIRLAGLFPNPGNVLRPGQYGRVRAVTETRTAALLVPQRAVTELQGSYQVAVVGSDNKVDIRAVKVGNRIGEMWIIEDGLRSGERVVAEGTQKVKPEAVVIPIPFTAPSTTVAQQR
jgi:RND family efflux transporter MFP subunit